MREKIESVVFALNPKLSPTNNKTSFTGQHADTLPITMLEVTNISPPKLGQLYPSRVLAEASADGVWEECEIALVQVDTELRIGQQIDETIPFKQRYGIKAVRIARVLRTEDESGVLRNIETDVDFEASNSGRRIIIELNPQQFIQDGVELYESFNLIVKINDLWKPSPIDSHNVLGKYANIPAWLRGAYLGYGSPDEDETDVTSEYVDTFLSVEHVKSSFPDKKVTIPNDSNPPYRLTIGEESVQVESFDSQSCTLFETPKMNTIRYTPQQVNAITSAMKSGLTVISGPTGTGKTQVGAQIIANLYRNLKQRILVLVKSEQTLHDVLFKLSELDVQQNHIISVAQSTKQVYEYYSKQGRLNYMLHRRMELLKIVDQLATSLNLTQYVGSTCENAQYFFLSQITSRWEQFKQSWYEISKTLTFSSSNALVSDHFPFSNYFKITFQGSYETDMSTADQCYRYLTKIFDELSQYRALEIIRGETERYQYLLDNARIVVATVNQVPVDQFDTVIVEDAHNMLQFDTLIQDRRLQRLVLIGDETAPTSSVRNPILCTCNHMDMSLFHRVCLLDISPPIRFYDQAKMRPSIAALVPLYTSSLLHTQDDHNQGFAYTHQVINVGDFMNRSEIQTRANVWVNIGEAEYIVAVYMYMRLIGYPKERITIMTTHNSQKDLIQDVLDRRCSHPLFGIPRVVTTDSNETNDYVLLSLVRTTSVDHVRSIPVVYHLFTRARLGLYVFCRASTYESVELEPVWKHFENTRDLQLCTSETYGNGRQGNTTTIKDVAEMGKLVHTLAQNKV